MDILSCKASNRRLPLPSMGREEVRCRAPTDYVSNCQAPFDLHMSRTKSQLLTEVYVAMILCHIYLPGV